jgi:prevent-host-death family protein
MQTEAGIRALRNRLSAYLRQVRAGETVIITNRGKQVGRIVPEGQPPEEHLKALNQAGLVAWSGKRLLEKLGETGERIVDAGQGFTPLISGT